MLACGLGRGVKPQKPGEGNDPRQAHVISEAVGLCLAFTEPLYILPPAPAPSSTPGYGNGSGLGATGLREGSLAWVLRDGEGGEKQELGGLAESILASLSPQA